MYRGAHQRMRLRVLPPMQDGTERPAETTDLEHPESFQHWAAEAFLDCTRAHQQRGADDAHQHSEIGSGGNAVASRNYRLDAGYPERLHGDHQRSQAAGYQKFRESQQPGADADGDHAENRGKHQFAPGWNMRLRRKRDREHHRARNEIAHAHQFERMYPLQRDADSEVRRAPEKTHRGQCQIGADVGLDFQEFRVTLRVDYHPHNQPIH